MSLDAIKLKEKFKNAGYDLFSLDAYAEMITWQDRGEDWADYWENENNIYEIGAYWVEYTPKEIIDLYDDEKIQNCQKDGVIAMDKLIYYIDRRTEGQWEILPNGKILYNEENL